MIAADALLIRQKKACPATLGCKAARPGNLFGRGGLSLGMQTAGIELAAHIEIDPEAAESYALNFANGRDLDRPLGHGHGTCRRSRPQSW